MHGSLLVARTSFHEGPTFLGVCTLAVVALRHPAGRCKGERYCLYRSLQGCVEFGSPPPSCVAVGSAFALKCWRQHTWLHVMANTLGQGANMFRKPVCNTMLPHILFVRLLVLGHMRCGVLSFPPSGTNRDTKGAKL